MDSDSSGFYDTSYETDLRIEKELREEREAENLLREQNNLERQRKYEKYKNSDLKILRLKSLQFHTFRHNKIKFSFFPSKLSKYITKKAVFFVSLWYRGNYWRVKRDTVPLNCKNDIYKLFYGGKTFSVDDENIFQTLIEIYLIFIKWTQSYEEIRLDKFKRYKNGEDVWLSSEDEEIFLTEEERDELFQKRTKVLRRMIPPKK